MALTQIKDPHCLGTGISPATGTTCHVCGGDGLITPHGTHQMAEIHAVEAHTLCVDILDKCTDILDKCVDILERVSE